MIRRLATLSARQQAICACILLFVFGYVCYIGILEPQLMELRADRAQLSAQQQLLAAKRLRIAEYVVEQETRDHLQEELIRSNARCFSPSESRDFFAGLDALVGSSNCQLTAMDFLPREEVVGTVKHRPETQSQATADEATGTANNGGGKGPRRIARISSRLSVVGTYADIIKLLEAIEANPRVVHVTRLRLALISQDTSELDAGFTLAIFVLEEENEEA